MKKTTMLFIIFLSFLNCIVAPDYLAADEECEDYHFHFHCVDDTDLPRPNYFTTYLMCRSDDCKAECNDYMKRFPDTDGTEEWSEHSEECIANGDVISSFNGDDLCYDMCYGYVGWYLHWILNEEVWNDCGSEIKDVIQGICFMFMEPEDEDEVDCCLEDEESCCKSKICADDKVGNPIHILSGANKEKETDVQFNTPFGKGFKVYRSYNSRSEMDSPIGFGWNHNYHVVLEFSPPPFEAHRCTIRDEHGRSHHFFDNEEDEVYEGLRSYNGNVVHNPDGTYTWNRPNGIEYKFDNLFRFIAKEDGGGNIQSLTYDEQGRLTGVSDDATGRSLGFVYNAEGRIDHITGPATPAVPDGVWVSYQYDVAGNLTRVEYADDDNGSPASGFEYKYEDANDAHNLTEKRNLAGDFLSSWQYDARDIASQNTTREGKSVSIREGAFETVVTDEQGVEKTYSFVIINGRKTITDISGGGGCASCGEDAIRYVYDDKRRVTEIEYANGRIDRYADFDPQDRYTTEIRAAGTPDERTIHHTYHPVTGASLSIVEASIFPGGNRETIFDYDNDANATPNENPTRLMRRRIERGQTFDAAGIPIPYEHITTTTYTATGQIETIDGPLPGNQDRVAFTYDPISGDKLTEMRPLVGTTSYGYDAAGNVTSITDAAGVVTAFTYDGRNRLLSSTRNGVTTRRTYTADGDPATETDALDRTIGYAYNAAGLIEKIIDPSGNFIYHGYNSYGQRIEESIFAADNTQTHYRGTVYGDPVADPGLVSGKPWKSIYRNADDSADLETVYAYDSSGNLKSVTDANDMTTSYVHDLFDRLHQVIQSGDTTTTYAYDSQGNLTAVTDPEGHVTTYIYDDLGRLVKTDSPDSGVTLYRYDESGRLRFKVQNNKSVEYRHDPLGRLTHILYSDPTRNVTLTYDSGAGANLLGRLASVSDPSGVTEYSYDVDGRLEKETRTVNGTAFITGYGYDAAGNLRSITYPTGQSVEYQPDPADPARIAAVVLNPTGGGLTLASDITYKPFGPMDAMTMAINIPISNTYDKNYKLLHTSAGALIDRTYIPDNVGNIQTITDNLDGARSQSFAYDDLYRLTGASGIYGTVNFTYDRAGNRLTRTQTAPSASQDSYTYYPGTNRLHTVAGTHAEQFQYDADGNLTQRVRNAASLPVIVPSSYTYNSAGQRAIKDAANDVIYHYDRYRQLIAETDTSGTMLRAYVWLFGQPLAMIGADGAVYYFHNDHLGTPQKMTDTSGTVVWTADYLPFGQADVTVATIDNPLRFAGQYYDSETGLHYNWNRYYDPKLGRYLRADPIGLKGGMNVFSYVQNNPIILVDPSGLEVPGPGDSPFWAPEPAEGTFGFDVGAVRVVGVIAWQCCNKKKMVRHVYQKQCTGPVAGISLTVSGFPFIAPSRCGNPPKELPGGEFTISPGAGAEVGFGGPIGAESPSVGASVGGKVGVAQCWYELRSSKEIGCCNE